MKATETKAEQESGIGIKGGGKAEVFVMHLFLLRDKAENFFPPLYTMGVDKVTRRQAWKKADRNGGQWKDEDDVMFFIYTPDSTVSLVSTRVRRIDLSCSLSRCHPGRIFIL